MGIIDKDRSFIEKKRQLRVFYQKNEENWQLCSANKKITLIIANKSGQFDE